MSPDDFLTFSEVLSVVRGKETPEYTTRIRGGKTEKQKQKKESFLSVLGRERREREWSGGPTGLLTPSWNLRRETILETIDLDNLITILPKTSTRDERDGR